MLNIIQQTYGNQIDLTTDEEENCQVTGFFFYLEMTLSTRLFRIKQQIEGVEGEGVEGEGVIVCSYSDLSNVFFKYRKMN